MGRSEEGKENEYGGHDTDRSYCSLRFGSPLHHILSLPLLLQREKGRELRNPRAGKRFLCIKDTLFLNANVRNLA